MKQKTFSKGIEELCEIFPDKQFNVELYWKYLKDIPDDRFELAIKDICSTMSEVYPNTNFIGIIRELALSGVYKLSGEAWEEVLKQVTRRGYVSTPRFEDKLIDKTIKCIGWRDICLSENISIERAHFIKAYDQLLNREKSEEVKIEACKQINREGVKKIKNLMEGKI